MNILDEILENQRIIFKRLDALENKDNDTLLSVKETAELFNTSIQEVYRKIKAGVIMPQKFGGLIRIRKGDLINLKREEAQNEEQK